MNDGPQGESDIGVDTPSDEHASSGHTEEGAAVPQSPARRDFLPMAFAVQLGIVVLAILLGWAFGERFWERMHFTPGAIALGVAYTLPLVILVIGISESGWTWGPFGTLERDFEKIVLLFRQCTTTDLLLISILAGVGEEALFRGVIQAFAAGWMNPWAAVILASAIFGALHAVSLAYVLGVFIIGLYLGALYIWYDNLAVPVIVHGLYDFAALIYAVRLKRGAGS